MKKIITIILYFISLVINFIFTNTLFGLALFDNCHGMLSNNATQCLNNNMGLFSLALLSKELTILLIILGIVFLITSILLIKIIRDSNMDKKKKNILIMLIVLSLLSNTIIYVAFRYINNDHFTRLLNLKESLLVH